MHSPKYPYAVRLIGFSPGEGVQLATALMRGPGGDTTYSCLLEDSLQEPDLFIANGDDLKALAILMTGNPSAIQPALIIGQGAVELPFPQLARPLDMGALFGQLAALLHLRAEAIGVLKSRGMPIVAERRRRRRLDFDLSDPADYASLRRAPPRGAVLIVDKGARLRDHLARLLESRKLSIEWTDSAATAVKLCEETPVSVVLINTSTPDIDPYALCATIKGLNKAERIAVVLLVGPNFAYDTARARAAGVRGLLDKPIADRHLLGSMQKLLSLDG
ncbi:MAG: response regulator [Pseudomonadota bacterium]